MKKQFLKFSMLSAILVAALFTANVANAQGFSGFLKNLKKQSQNSGNSGALSNSDITAGLKQALEKGAQEASKNLSKTDGYFKNEAVKILLPPEVQKVASTLQSIGMGRLVDDAVLSMNRAAEDAAVKAAPIFVNAIKKMTIQDGMNILKGPNDAATSYLQKSTTSELTTAFSPVINQSLQKVGATKAWKQVFDTYNRIPMVQKVNSDLGAYVTEHALIGLFKQVAAEELKIRTDPAARTTEILRKVFK